MDTICKNCGSDDLRYKRGCLTCKKCGVVAGNELDDRAEWRTFYDNEGGEDMCRVGDPLDEGLTGMLTCIGDGPGAAALRRTQMRTLVRPPCDKDFDIKAISALGASDAIAHMAKQILIHTNRDKASNQGIGKSAIAAAALYFACKKESLHRNIEQFVSAFDITVSKFHHACAYIQSAMVGHPLFKDIVKHVSCRDVVYPMVYSVDSIKDKNKWDVIKTCLRLLDIIGEMSDFKGQRPSKIAPTLIYISCCINKIPVKKNDISTELDVSVVTIKKHELLIQNLLEVARQAKKG